MINILNGFLFYTLFILIDKGIYRFYISKFEKRMNWYKTNVGTVQLIASFFALVIQLIISYQFRLSEFSF